MGASSMRHRSSAPTWASLDAPWRATPESASGSEAGFDEGQVRAYRFEAPDLIRVRADGRVAGEPAGADDVGERHAGPGGPVRVRGGGAGLAGDVVREVGAHHVGVVVPQTVDDRAIAIAIAQ